MPSKQLLDP
uniref:Uncharacterized protein MANES_01G194400 n=1 Tax=Rhizophora mucronata TaxID=61149 RepID=A0A2P2QE64_RHIMU